jgi:predicted alpha/beta hydrolase family esterase
MKKQILFIHSAGAKEEGSGALIRFLENHLSQFFEIHAPDMPQPDQPQFVRWRNTIEQELSALDGDIFLIGHSLGGSVLLKYLAEDSRAKRIQALFLVAIPYWGKKNWNVDDFLLPKDYAGKLGDIPQIFLYRSRGDDVIPEDHLQQYRKEITHAQVRELAGREHAFMNGLPELVADLLGLTEQSS